MSLESNKLLVRRLLEDDLSRGDEVVADEVVHPEFFDHTNPPEMKHGVEGHKAIGLLFRSAYPDLWWQIDDLIAEGDKVVARTTMSGTHSGDFFRIAPTGRRVSMVGVHVFRIQDGKVAEHWGSNDDLSLMRQLGVLPA